MADANEQAAAPNGDSRSTVRAAVARYNSVAHSCTADRRHEGGVDRNRRMVQVPSDRPTLATQAQLQHRAVGSSTRGREARAPKSTADGSYTAQLTVSLKSSSSGEWTYHVLQLFQHFTPLHHSLSVMLTPSPTKALTHPPQLSHPPVSPSLRSGQPHSRYSCKSPCKSARLTRRSSSPIVCVQPPPTWHSLSTVLCSHRPFA